jgi:hypothetical protein
MHLQKWLYSFLQTLCAEKKANDTLANMKVIDLMKQSDLLNKD